MMTSEPASSDDLGPSVLSSAIDVFRANKQLADRAIAQLADDQLRMPLDRNTNSIAVIMKHIAGNLRSRWTDFLSTDGEKPGRDRDSEFVDTFAGRAELLAWWESGWACLFATLAALQPADLAKTVTIRGEPHTVPLAIQRSSTHGAYHIGQIVLIAHILAGDSWETLTIPRHQSAAYNQRKWGQAADRPPDEV